MRIVIDWDLCQGHACCMGEAPEVFSVGGDGGLQAAAVKTSHAVRMGSFIPQDGMETR